MKVRAGTDDAHAVGPLEQLLQGVHGAVHFAVIQAADVEKVVLKGLRAHVGHLRHGGRGIAQDAPLGFGHADFAMYGRPVVGHIIVHLFCGHVGHFRGIAAAPHADVGLHPGHERAVHLGAQLQLLHGAVHDELAVHRLVAKPQEGNAAGAVRLLDERAGQVIIAADGFDQDVFALLQAAGVMNQVVGQLLDSRIKHGNTSVFANHQKFNSIIPRNGRKIHTANRGGRKDAAPQMSTL